MPAERIEEIRRIAKQTRAGESFHLLVTVLKVRKGVPTVIRVDGREYVLRSPDQFGNRKRGVGGNDRATSR